MKKGILDKLETFHANLEVEKMMAQENGDIHPMVEAPRDVIEHLNRGPLIKAFDKVGYCIYHGAMVCEVGKKEQILQWLEDSNTLGPHELRAKK